MPDSLRAKWMKGGTWVWLALCVVMAIGMYGAPKKGGHGVVLIVLFALTGAPLLLWAIRRVCFLAASYQAARPQNAVRERVAEYFAYVTVTDVLKRMLMLALASFFLSFSFAAALRIRDDDIAFGLVIACGALVLSAAVAVFTIGKIALVPPSLRVEIGIGKALVNAARSGEPDEVERLLDQGAPISGRQRDHLTPLHAAAQRGRRDVAELLIARGADVNAVSDDGGHTPLHKAAIVGHTQVAELLIANGAAVDARNSGWLDSGCTALHMAAESGSKGMVELLLARGANIHATTDDGSTPLHCAASDRDLAERLMAHGADPRARDSSGKQPWQIAQHGGYREAMRMLAEAAGVELLDVESGKHVGLCAACGRPVLADERYFEKRESGIEPVSFPVKGARHYDAHVAFYHAACARRAGLV